MMGQLTQRKEGLSGVWERVLEEEGRGDVLCIQGPVNIQAAIKMKRQNNVSDLPLTEISWAA